MTLNLFSIEDKIAAIEAEIAEVRRFRREPGSPMQRHYMILKSIAADLRARAALPRSNALGALEREITKLKCSKTPHECERRMLELANLVISKWPTISQALELYGEESAE